MAGVPVILTAVFVVAVADCAENNKEQSNDEDADNWVWRAMDDFNLWLWVGINDDKLWVIEILTILVIIVVLASSVIDCDNYSKIVGVSVTISSRHVWTIVSIDIAWVAAWSRAWTWAWSPGCRSRSPGRWWGSCRASRTSIGWWRRVSWRGRISWWRRIGRRCSISWWRRIGRRCSISWWRRIGWRCSISWRRRIGWRCSISRAWWRGISWARRAAASTTSTGSSPCTDQIVFLSLVTILVIVLVRYGIYSSVNKLRLRDNANTQ